MADTKKSINSRDIIERMATEMEAERASAVAESDKTLLDEVAKLSDDDKNKLRKMLGIEPVKDGEGSEPKNEEVDEPAEEEDGEPVEDGEGETD